ncbi:MAG: hypothetical protein NZ928_01465 [Endomicrobia bacterium]|nr:hypothetical protein [Endomicrobiia bacterium]MDW8055113.1 hypothetical protein [Elusimicrobiota bacterium]
MNITKSLVILVVVSFFSCVTPRGTFYKGFDPQKITIISVGEFKPYGNYISSGELVKNLMIEHLLKRGYIVKEENSADVEYVLTGSVTRFLPEKKYLVYTGTEKQQVMIGGPLTEISGSYVYNIGSAFGIPDSQVVATNSTVGVSARLVEKKTGNVVWTSSFVYEALTVETAADVVANYLITSLTGKKGK